MRKGFWIGLCCLLLIAALPLAADDWDKKTTVTFDQPVQVPGMVLLPGTYMFKLMNSSSDRHIVTIYNEEGNHLYTTILTVNNYRVNPTANSAFKFSEERVKGAPQALRGWFWPGDTWGQEFVYPKVQAQAIAQTVKEPVLSAEVKPAEPAEQLIEEPIVAVEPEIKEVEVEIAAPVPLEPAPEVIAEATPPAAPGPVPVQELPKTGSPAFVIGIAGLLITTVGYGLRRLGLRNS